MNHLGVFKVAACTLWFAVRPAANDVRAGDQPEVRHLHHDRDPAQHDDDGDRALRAASAARGRALHHQSDLHHHLHARVRDEDHRTATLLLPRAVERLRLRRRHLVHSRQETAAFSLHSWFRSQPQHTFVQHMTRVHYCLADLSSGSCIAVRESQKRRFCA